MEEAQTSRGKWTRCLGWSLAVLGALAITTFIAVSLMIGSDVRAAEKAALREHPGDPVAALIAYADTTEHGLRERNRAVWALGQLGSPRALPVLEKYFTGGPCHRERELCQRELSKAIELCRGGMNATAIVWRPGSLRP